MLQYKCGRGMVTKSQGERMYWIICAIAIFAIIARAAAEAAGAYVEA